MPSAAALLGDLRESHLQKLYATMRQLNRDEDGNRSEILRRLAEARATWHGRRVSGRPLTDARIRRVHAVLRAALNDASIPVNPAARLKLGKARKRRPLLWTEPRVAAWRETGKVPAPVMVWNAAQCGAFLDGTEGERLYALYHLAAYYGLRRSELAGLEWIDVDLAARRVSVRQAQVDDELDDTKSEDSDRIITIDQATADVLKTWRKDQLAERMAWGPAWADSGRVFTREDGRPLRPEWISERFVTLAARLGLPPVRFHDLRHGAATMLVAAGQPAKVVSEVLGHSTVAFTMDVYTSVAEELAESAAAAIAAYVPRRGRTGAAE
jgi:integrase